MFQVTNDYSATAQHSDLQHMLSTQLPLRSPESGPRTM
jgi:hypothetical protein